ncbi:MAG: UDP-N-acetylmuramoyl-tripeptide--D-alanyl-D-alanine ligase, partial [bacterium]|nr:UDP-N-acetylmuramoyl-tripeptide--D-alanyl-D-alanine ligase [bacterium]
MSPEAFLPVLIILWSIQAAKSVLFWLYLWQLKEYHLKRFIDHFRTEKGRRIILNPFRLIKIPLLFLALVSPIFWPLFFIYALEAIFFFAKKGVKKPVPTVKIILLLTVNITILPLVAGQLNIWLSNRTSLALLITDILLPIIVSIIILSLQPLTVMLRQQIINKAKAKRANFKNLKVIGITGSYGKTSTKEILKTILEQKFKILATKEHQNSEIGISRCILDELKSEHQVFICEMGAYDKGKIKEVTSIAQPQIGIVTGINEQHLALFGSMENLMSAEGGLELAENLPQNGVMILNGDNEIIQNIHLRWTNRRLARYCSTKKETDLWAKNIIIEKEALSFTVCDKAGDSANLKINLIGRYNIENILLAAATAEELGISLSEIAAACEKIKPEQGAIKLSRKEGGADIIDSSYSANPDGVLTALEHLKLWPGKKVIIMPCLIELGPAAKKVHEKIGSKIGQICDLAIITTKDWFEEIKKSAIKAEMKSENIVFLENREEIIEKIKPFLQP